MATDSNEAGLWRTVNYTATVARANGQELDDLVVGLQLTHSGRFCKPHDHCRWEPRIAYHHPLLDPKFNIAPDDSSVLL
ncbi:MAG: hypothetical protein R3C56_02645 [Pirellulaceae bacterium]